jgi:hypothetical protein
MSVPSPLTPGQRWRSTNKTFHQSLFTGQWEDYFCVGIFAVFCTTFVIYIYFHHKMYQSGVYYANLAWMRALIFFCFCVLVGYFSGVFQQFWREGAIRDGDVRDPVFCALTLFIVAFEFISYWIFWPFGTVTYGRKFFLPTSLVMGILWGFSETMLFLSFWSLLEIAPIPRWGIVLILMFLPVQTIWHMLLWNQYISPEHNILECNKWKVIFCHIPNTILTLCYFALYGYVKLHVLFYTISLCGPTFFYEVSATLE